MRKGITFLSLLFFVLSITGQIVNVGTGSATFSGEAQTSISDGGKSSELFNLLNNGMIWSFVQPVKD
jgi:hypothetical protein